jgi:hypothetical protein
MLIGMGDACGGVKAVGWLVPGGEGGVRISAGGRTKPCRTSKPDELLSA